MNNYHLYLDYLELRRRVERHLARALPLVGHVVLFAVVVTLIGWNGYQGFRDPNDYYFIAPELGRFVAVWSVLLLLHTLWQTLRSGFLGHIRNRAIEKEMRDRVELNDSYLTDDPKMLFRLHGLLDWDVRQRSTLFALLLSIVVINTFIWLPWAMEDARTSRGWIMAQWLELLLLPILLGYGVWRSRQESVSRKQLEMLPPQNSYGVDDTEVTFRLSDDGELVDFPDPTAELKKKRS